MKIQGKYLKSKDIFRYTFIAPDGTSFNLELSGIENEQMGRQLIKANREYLRTVANENKSRV